MAFADINSRQAILDAVAEFDRIGRAEFLEEHGYREAERYYLEVNGRLYDSKAIVGVAHKYQFPAEGALVSADFSGGASTVQRKLEDLGFRVVQRHKTSIGSPMTTALETEFDAAMMDIYRHARTKANYTATRFLQMLNEHRGLKTAQLLLHATHVSDGYTALWERGRLDLTVEALILEPRWHGLFTDEDREIARDRLRKYRFDVSSLEVETEG